MTPSVSAIEPQYDGDLLKSSLLDWCPDADTKALRPLSGGYSGATVLLFDLERKAQRPEGDPDWLQSGFYILKLDTSREREGSDLDEAQRHLDVSRWAEEFAKAHVPPLRRQYKNGNRVALLYEIAGRSFARLVRSELIALGPLETRLRSLSVKLLKNLNRDVDISRGETVRQLMTEWLSWRLEESSAPNLFALAASLTGNKRSFVQKLHFLANPLLLANSIFAQSQVSVVFRGLLHGDMHRENVFWDRPPESEQFWIIDFALSRNGPLLFDHAYLELSLLLQYLEGADPARLLNLLDTFYHATTEMGTRFIAPADEGTRSLIAAFRQGVTDWQQSMQELRADAVEEQWCLARVAVGLNWANKRIGEAAARNAFLYAAHAAKIYLEQFHQEEWARWAEDCETSAKSPGAGESSPSPHDAEWQQFWTEMDGFSPTNYFVLLAGRLGDAEGLAAFGQLPWSAVLDFDPDSDARGLLKRARANLERERSFHLFGKTVPAMSVARGTAWMMAAGSTTLKEPLASSLAEWRPRYKHVIRSLAAMIRSQSAPSPVRVLVLPGDETHHELMVRALEEIVDELGMDRKVVVIADKAGWQAEEVNTTITISVDRLAARISSVFGLSTDPNKALVPGVSGPVELDIVKIRNFEEDFEVLHSAILTDAAPTNDESFWRGAPPTWRDIESQGPVQRPVEQKLVQEIQARLKVKETSELEFFHTPGAGGTTVALMAAWTLRRQYPTVILRRKSKNVADRAGWLFHLTGMPILLVADASVLTKTEVDELVWKLSNDNVRAVIVNVIRVPKRAENRLGVYDPVEADEADRFARSFSRRTKDPGKAALLRAVADPTNSEHAALRSPFFFGLITFESDFTHLADYVRHHLGDGTYPERKIIQYLSVVAGFSQTALSSALVYRMMNLRSGGGRTIGHELGASVARLIVEWQKTVKMVHPLVAHEALSQLGGGSDKWRWGLTDLCVDLAKHVLEAAGSYSDEVQHLFRNLFIEREDWSAEESSYVKPRFSPLLMAIPSDAGRGRLLETLTELCPADAHFWNHRGRHAAYSDSPNYRIAEQYLLKAVELSDGRDPLHHHSLGMVRRMWIQRTVRDLAAKAHADKQPLAPAKLFAEIASLVKSALAAFAEARKINPEGEYGYVTAVQTTLFIIEELTKAGGEGFDQLSVGTDAVGNWLREQTASAELLLARLAKIRGAREESSYEIECLTRLAKLYGNFELIRTWEGMLDSTSEPTILRRAIVGLYLAKRRRQWSALEPKELRRIMKLAEDNLREDPADERDLRVWFQAMRRLPEFNYFEAIERLEAWASSGNSLDAFFYLYVLHFLRWGVEKDEAEETIQKNIKECLERRVGQRGYSHEWLAREPSWCPIASANELGEWDRQRNFFVDPSKLTFASGTIESLKPQAGTIRLGRFLRAFFVPPGDIRESVHLNETVHFYLGFSYEGFRAWGVKLGAPPIAAEVSAKPAAQPKTPLKLWVGGIPFQYKELDVRALFEPFGRVNSVEIPSQSGHGSNRGYCFVIMSSKLEGIQAIQRLNGKRTSQGRQLRVRESDESKH